MQIVNQQYSLMGFVQHFFRPSVHRIRKYNSVGDLTRRSHGTWRPKFPNFNLCCQYPPYDKDWHRVVIYEKFLAIKVKTLKRSDGSPQFYRRTNFAIKVLWRLYYDTV